MVRKTYQGSTNSILLFFVVFIISIILYHFL